LENTSTIGGLFALATARTDHVVKIERTFTSQQQQRRLSSKEFGEGARSWLNVRWYLSSKL